ncbi:hypothetical protein [Kozakia baliensis]|uniref:hypothetical protein n=1 Tax=Kozakia baliensis TaxID=153496 RepID=UPI00049521CD|nr:hypothetical protein [Kozakia baliensis]AOX20621.1 hypothetical protein A0U90_10310 [Kozakia baliensis]
MLRIAVPLLSALWACAVANVTAEAMAADIGMAENFSENKPVIVTSDSSDYCRNLRDKVDDAIKAAPEHTHAQIDQTQTLKKDGTALCDAGHIRPGIAQLRRALKLAHGQESDNS